MIDVIILENLLEKISVQTSQMNHSLIYDVYVGRHDISRSKSKFVKKGIIHATKGECWGDLDDILSKADIPSNYTHFTYKIFIKDIISHIAPVCRKELEIVLRKQIPPDVTVEAFNIAVVNDMYPFFNAFYFIKATDWYATIAIGYSD